MICSSFLSYLKVVRELKPLISESKAYAFCYSALKANEKFTIVGSMALFF